MWTNNPTLLSEVTGVVPLNWRLSTVAKVKTEVEGIQHSIEIITGKACNLNIHFLTNSICSLKQTLIYLK
jgi:hypothetical protein